MELALEIIEKDRCVIDFFDKIYSFPEFVNAFCKSIENEKIVVDITGGIDSRFLVSALYFHNVKFDMIYIDGNHDRRYVLHDAIMSIKKLKHMGFLIFDDMQSEEVFLSVHLFVQLFEKQIVRFLDVP